MAVSTPSRAEASERDHVLAYLWTRTNEAFRDGKDVEAQDCHRFYGIIEGLSDDEYTETYDECDPADL